MEGKAKTAYTFLENEDNEENKRNLGEECFVVEKDLRVEKRDDDVMNKKDSRNHGKDCVKLEHDLRVKMIDADYKEVDISAVSTNTDQTPSW